MNVNKVSKLAALAPVVPDMLIKQITVIYLKRNKALKYPHKTTNIKIIILRRFFLKKRLLKCVLNMKDSRTIHTWRGGE